MTGKKMGYSAKIVAAAIAMAIGLGAAAAGTAYGDVIVVDAGGVLLLAGVLGAAGAGPRGRQPVRIEDAEDKR